MAKYRFDQIAINSTEKKKPVEEDRFTYLGLEHLDSGSLKVTRYGSEVAPIGEKLIMRKGDVLFGKRRAYQKKVAIAPFDGIFSAHGMVLRPKEDVIDKNFFPLFISSDYFLDVAIKISVGSLSPTINWRDLKELEFELPDLDTQRRLATVLWAMNETMDSYKELISATDELVKSQFIEMFGNPESNPMGWRKERYENICSVITDGEHATPKRSEHGIYLLSARNVLNHKLSFDEVDYIDEAEYERIAKRIIPKAGDILISCSGTVGRACVVPVGLRFQMVRSVALIRLQECILPEFMEQMIMMPYTQKQIEASKSQTSQANLFQGKIQKLEAIVPPITLQQQFMSFVRQSDKSKFEIEQALSELVATYKRIIKENLG